MFDLSKFKDSVAKNVSLPLSEATKKTWIMRAFGFAKVPMLFMTSPKVLVLNEQECHVQIPFRKFVKNHLGSLYFGAFAVGADTCVGLLAMEKIFKSPHKVSMVFKDFSIDFLKRAEGPTTFVCEKGQEVTRLFEQALSTGKRVHQSMEGYALCKDQVVARFHLTLSLKKLSTP